MTHVATRHLTLPDQRRLSFHDFGSGQRGTWIHCHGIPGSRLELLHLEADLVQAGVRIIVPDRPGYGESSPATDYGFPTHSRDIAALADHLGIERFSVSGFSGGGVFALALANNLAHRIEQVTAAATPAAPLLNRPHDHVSEMTANAWRAAETGAAPLASMLEPLASSHQALAEAMINAAGDNERPYLQSPPIRAGIDSNMRAALAQGPTRSANAMARDTFLITHPWPLDLASTDLPVRLLHGEEDAIVHAIHLNALAKSIPDSQAACIAGAGHYSLLPLIWGL